MFYAWIGVHSMVCRIRKNFTALSCLLLSILIPVQSQAFEIITNGFGTICASKSDISKSSAINVPYYPFATQIRTSGAGGVPPFAAATYYRPTYVGAERRWNFLPNSKLALQFTSLFDDKFKAVMQLIGRWETMTTDHYTAKMDWAYVQYNHNNNIDALFGRFRVPAFYYSDYLDVNNAQPWVAPPDEVYFIVGGAFRNMDGVKARYSNYIGNWNFNSQAYFGSMEERLFIAFSDVGVKVRDTAGITAQIDNDILTFRGSVMRSIYDTNLYSPILALVSAADAYGGGSTAASRNLRKVLQDKDQGIIYVGLAAAANITDDLTLLVERASILSPGIISTARVGWYSSLSYSMDKFAYTFTTGFSRPLATEVRKFEAMKNFINTSQYQNLDFGVSGVGAGQAGAALVEAFRSYLGTQRSYAIDVRYDVLPSLALKGGIKLVTPSKGSGARYILNRLPVYKGIWVYRLSIDFVF